MIVYVFGNEDHPQDSLALKAIDKIGKIPELTFQVIPPNDDLPPDINKTISILDVVAGIDKVTLFTEADLDKIIPSPRTTAHDYDLSFQLKYLLKIGKISKMNIIGIPYDKEPDYDLVISILRKLVAQDMHGS